MYCCCSCTTAAAARALFWNRSLEKLVYWIICNVMHLSLPNLVHLGSLIFWIDSKEYWFSCSCSIVAAAAGLVPDKKLIKVVNWIVYTVQTLNMVIWYKLQPDIRDKKLWSQNFLGFCNVKNTWYKSLGFKGQPDIRTWFLGPDEVFYLI